MYNLALGQAGWDCVPPPFIGARAPAAESKMSGHSANQRLRTGLFLACVLTASLGLAACSDIDDMFGGASNDMSASAAPSPAGGAGAPPTAEAPPTAGGGGNALVATITPVTIEAGPDTGTAVNKTIQTLRGQMSGLEGKLAANAQRLSDLR